MMPRLPKWLREAAQHRDQTYERGRKGEKKVLRVVGGTATRRSGAGKQKGDGRRHTQHEELHIEIKTTTQEGFRLTRRLLKRLRREASYSRIPTLIIRWSSQDQWACVPLSVLRQWLAERD